VTRAHDGLRLDREPFSLAAPTAEPDVVVGRRIGIARGVETPWRFGLAGSRFLSRPFRSSAGAPHAPPGTDHAGRR
jgi:DNA-3-methyladenine glycosylase